MLCLFNINSILGTFITSNVVSNVTFQWCNRANLKIWPALSRLPSVQKISIPLQHRQKPKKMHSIHYITCLLVTVDFLEQLLHEVPDNS